MPIYTSYFAKMEKLPKDLVPIAICGKSPQWYHGIEYKKLAPKYDFFIKWKDTHDNNFYIENYYRRVLNPLNFQTVVKELTDCGKRNVVLLCYESPEKFCHRHLVSEWLRNNGIDSYEIKI